MLACLPPRHPCGERAAKAGAFRILWPFSLWEKFFIHNLVFFLSAAIRWLSDGDRRHCSSLSWCSSIPGMPTWSRCLPLPCFHNYVSVYFQKRLFLLCVLVLVSHALVETRPEPAMYLCGTKYFTVPPCYNMCMTNERFLSCERPTFFFFLL